MTAFYNLKTAHKLILGFGLCLALSILIGVVAITRMAQMNTITENILSDSVAGLEALGKFTSNSKQVRLIDYRFLVKIASPQDEATLLATEGEVDQNLAEYGTSVTDPVDTQNYNNLKSTWQQYKAANTIFLQNVHAGNFGGALSEMKQTRNINASLSSIGDAMIDWNQKHGEEYAKQAQLAYSTARMMIIGLLLLSALFGSLAAWLITRYMTQCLAQIAERMKKLDDICFTNLTSAVEALEQGDLTAEIKTGTEPLPARTNDEFGDVERTFNTILTRVKMTITSFRTSQASLSALVRDMQQSAGQVDSAAQTLSGTSQQIGAATEEIGATMHEVAQASEQSARGASEIAQGSASQAASIAGGAEQVKELVAAVLGVTRDTEAATQSAELATQTASAGAAAVEQSVAGMQRIQSAVSESAGVIASLGQTSAKIGGIVQTIDEIAGQTNLLALNAAIEAARAGEAGRGFAVVADEVRKLAERCTVATKDIGELIGEMQGQTQRAVSAMELGTREVTAGTSLAGQAGAALSRIQSVVSEMSGRVLSIGAASEEMSASAQEVSATISEVAAVIEESSAAAEEMSASAEEVSASVQTVAGTTSQQGAAVEELVASASELAGVSQSLNALVSRFKIEGGHSSEQSAPMASAKPTLTLRKVA